MTDEILKNITFSKCTEKQIDEVYRIEIEGSNLWKRKYFFDEIDIDFSDFTIAVVDNKIAGFIIIWNLKGDLQINNIAVKKSLRRKGIAAAMINHVVELFKDEKPERIFLEVKEKNFLAINFYESTGFIKSGVRKNYYADDNAVLMEKKLNYET